ncbi:asparagine synthase (glutamine-hydrolyzing) [Natronomonas pharaonis DSM 2160]|uniref:Asparagine synthase (Glutamine-hydrolyzing) n=1 Tax=Natronomonas pharaonis (strain ATCC 35678 / DSM 2160 / CIP 103997 / JCM 8858 / NBRC 14720 / NCIMB 2260 / Gabara) TaxID=348780 RepID=A0A1U7EWU7_NATPD|nr:asparagine synthase-related protein [Natronomonas pharaonis]CAI49580.1 asparagine synthase (glutamine-hydrolyzing) [Natronomonas pharaonis DSM 2160]
MQGTAVEAVRECLETKAPLAGTCGFAGELDGGVVRDVLGRYPAFTEPETPSAWSPDPTDLSEPEPVPAGCIRTADGDRQVWSLPDPEPVADTDRAVSAVADAIDAAIDSVDGAPAVAFSGGIDSSLLAAGLDGPLYVGGFEGSHDITAARSAADLLDRRVRVVEFTHADLERATPTVVEATGRSNPMDVQLALSLYLIAEAVAEDGHDRLALGQGADELFGGYAKVAKAPADPRVDADTVRGARREVVGSLPSQLERDVLAVRAAGIEPVTPLLCDGVVSAALRLPAELLVAGDTRKVALRRAAETVPDGGVPADIRDREKKALQYGSLLAREFDRLARQAGFKRRMDNHLGKYIEDRCQDA